MIVQPTSTNPRGRLGRTLRIAGLVLPPALLVVIIGAAIAGPRPEATVAPSAPPATPATERPAPPAVAQARFPTAAAGLAVRSVAEAQPLLARADGQPVAVAGWLGELQPDPGCATAAGDTRGILSPLCARTLRLEATPPGTASRGHVHVHVAPGVRLPPPFEWPGAEHADPVPVVLVGRAATPDADCTRSTRGCDEQLALDLVTWAGEAPFTPGVVFDAGLEVPPPSIAYRYRAEAESLAIGWSGTILVSAVVRPATVAAIDPEAAAALDRAPRPAGLVWYVRGLETTYGPGRFPPGDYPPRERWVVLDETTGLPVTTGITGQPDATGPDLSSAAAPRLQAAMSAGMTVPKAGVDLDAGPTAPLPEVAPDTADRCRGQSAR